MDLNMPQMTGEEASTAIFKLVAKQKKPVNQPAIIALTSQTNLKVKENCLKIGMKNLFNKPLNLEDL